jgi:dihydropyrimidinase
MNTKTVIRGGTIVTAGDTYQADLLLEGEKIVLLQKSLKIENAQVVDATGKYILPGGIDPHVHLDLPMFDTVSSDDHYTGGKAAAFGGTTMVIDFVSQNFPTLKECIEDWRTKADKNTSIDYGFHMNITRLDEQVLAEIPSLLDLGVNSLKVFTAYNDRLRLDDGEIFQVMRKTAESGILTLLHAENGDVIDLLTTEALQAGHTDPIWHARTRPAWGAVESSLRGIALAAQTGAPLYLVHLNAAGEADQLRYGRDHGLPIMGETCPQYLFFNEEHLKRPDGAKWICSPPMRTPADNEGLWKRLLDGSIQVLATDHCPFFFDGTQAIDYEGSPIAIPGKELGASDFTKIPNGLPGLGDRMPVFWTQAVGSGQITPNEFVALTSTNAAKIFGMYPQKGTIAPGSDADLVIWDPEKRVSYGVAQAKHRTDYNLYEGWDLVGYPEKVFLRGKMIVDGDQWHGAPGMGRYVPRSSPCRVL